MCYLTQTEKTRGLRGTYILTSHGMHASEVDFKVDQDCVHVPVIVYSCCTLVLI